MNNFNQTTNGFNKTTNYDAIADEYIKTEISPLRRYVEKATVLNILGNVQGKSVLDLACGLGKYSRAVKELGASRVVGADNSKEMINQAKLLEQRQPLGIEYLTGDAAQLEDLGTFDIVTAMFLFPYAQTRQTLLDMFSVVFKNLKDSGRLVALTVNPSVPASYFTAPNKHGVYPEANGPIQDGTPIKIKLRYNTQDRDIDLINYYWSKETYDSCLREIGFKQIKWHKMDVSREGIEKYGEGYWQDYLASPHTIVLECNK